MSRVVVTADADADTNEILRYLEREAGPVVAREYGRRFRVAIERIVALLESGALRPVLGPNARVAIVFPYVLLYDYMREDDTVVVLRILHGKRDISSQLLRR